MIRRIALQTADLDRLLKKRVLYTRTLAKGLDRANTCTRRTDRIRVKDHAGRAHQVVGCDLLNEGRNVDVRRTRPCAWGVKTVETSIRFVHRLGRRESWVKIGEIALDLRYV